MSATNKTPNLDLPQWIAGDEIEREDFNDAFNILDLIGIVDAGTNANGSYLRFANGIQICWHRFEFSADIVAVWGTCFTSNTFSLPSYPKAFISDPIITLESDHTGAGSWTTQASAGTSSTPPKFFLTRPTSVVASTIRAVSYVAIGFWK